MKFVFVFVSLTCANLYFCGNASGQDPDKPSAHIEAAGGEKYYNMGSVLKDWDVSAPYSHLAGGMTYKDGKLIVPTTGLYYIYAQFYFRSTEGRIHVQVNNKLVILMEPSYVGKGPDETLETGGLFKLNAGDAISLTLHHGPAILVMASAHTYFGAVLM